MVSREMRRMTAAAALFAIVIALGGCANPTANSANSNNSTAQDIIAGRPASGWDSVGGGGGGGGGY